MQGWPDPTRSHDLMIVAWVVNSTLGRRGWWPHVGLHGYHNQALPNIGKRRLGMEEKVMEVMGNKVL